MRNCVYFMEKNVHGAWVVYGELGVRQYYYYTKKEARRRYIEECRATLLSIRELEGANQDDGTDEAAGRCRVSEGGVFPSLF